MRKGFNYWIGQFIKSIQKNRHTTANNQNSASLIKSLQGYTGVYDGKNHSISILTAENCEIEYSKDQTEWGPEAPSICNAGIYKTYVKVKKRKQVEYGSAVIKIKRRSIILSSASVTKEYDGIPAKNDEVIISGDGLLDGELINARATGVQHLVGKSINTIEYQFDSNVIEDNYSVNKEEGILEILDRKEKYCISIKGCDAQYKYDGNEHEVSGLEKLTFSEGGGSYHVCGINSHASLKHSGVIDTCVSGSCIIVDADGNNVSEQFQITIVPGKLSIMPRKIGLKSASDSQEYNGHELQNDNIKVSGDGFVKGEEPSFDVYGKQRLVGKSQNTFEYTFPKHVVSDDYLISVEYGDLEVLNRQEKYCVDIQLTGGEFIYDAKVHIAAGIVVNEVLIDDKLYRINVTDEPAKGINAGSYAHETVKAVHVYDVEQNDVTEQFDIHIHPGTLLIKKRDLVLISNSAVKEYDGTPLTKGSIQISGLGLADGDTITGFVDGSQLVVGKCRNSISYYFQRNELEDNYNVVVDEGTLEVIDRKIKLLITLEAKSADFQYDGTVHTVEGFHNNALKIYENEFTVTGIQARACLLHVGNVQTEVSGTAIITDSYGNDVSDQFDTFVIPGTLRIYPRRVTLTSSSASKEYDGTALTTSDIKITGDGFVQDETPSIVVSGKQLLVGSSKNMFSYTFPEGVLSTDYRISVRYGTLRVSNRLVKYEVDLHLNSGECLYDAIEHSVSGIVEKVIQIEGNSFLPVVSDRPALAVHAGLHAHDKVDTVRILDSEQCDVTEQFNIHVHPGTLSILKRDLILKSNSATKEYDGTPLTNTSIQISGLAEGDRISGFANGSQLVVGKSRNSISYLFHINELEDNYNITLDEGTLEITDRKEKLQITLRAKSAEYKYDGKIHFINELIENTETINGQVFTVSGIHVYVSQRHAGSSETMISGRAVVTDALNNDVSDQFNVQVLPGTLQINPRKVKLTSASASREYNGSALKMPRIEISGDGFVTGEEPVFVVSGEQRLVGHSANLFEYSFPNNAVPDNYQVSVEFGDLEVFDRQKKYSVDVHLNSGIYLYDAKEHAAAGINDNTVFVDDNEYTIEASDESVRETDAGNYVHDTVNEVRIFDSEKCDVSEQFEVNIVPGALSISPRFVKISSASSSKEYDGTYLTAPEIKISGDGFISGDEPSVFVSGKQKLVGVSENTFSFVLPDSVNKKDYLITTEYGKLEVLDRVVKYSVNIHLCDAEYLFDSKEHVVSGAVEQEVTLNGNIFNLIVEDEPVVGTEPGEYKHDKIKSVNIYDAENNDVTKQFNIRILQGRLTIRPNPEFNNPEDNKIDGYDIAIHDILNKMSGNEPSESYENIKKYSRKELEALYEDTKELIVSDGTILPFYKYLLEKRKGNSNLDVLHNRIVDQIQDVVLLSEIEINDSEYSTLIGYARKKFRTAVIRADFSYSDILFTMALVQIGVRKYANNYWHQVENELGKQIGPVERKWLGNTATQTFVALGKPIYSETEYVTNILMHCIVTDFYAKRFFDYLFSYYRLDLERDISGLQKTDIDYLCDSIINPYSKRKQLLSDYLSMSIRADKENCSAMIKKSLNMIDHSFWDEEINEDEALKGRMLKHFNEWLEQSQFYKLEKQKNKHRVGKGKRDRLFRTPHLRVDQYKKEFMIVLPQQLIPVREETQIPNVKWFIISNSKREYNCKLEEGYSGYKTNEIKLYVKPEEIFCKIVFLLFADKALIRSFSWDSHKAAFFDEYWEWMPGSKLGLGKAYAYCQHECSIESKAILYKSWFRGLRYYEFNLREGDFVLVHGEDNYYVGKVPTTGLNENGIVKDVTITYKNIQKLPVYAKPPILVIEIEEGQLPGTAIITNGKISRLADVKFIDVQVGNTSDTKYYFVYTQDLEGSCEGYNKIIVDYPNSPKQMYLEYYLSIGFHYKFKGAPYVFKDKGALAVMGREAVDFNMSSLVDGELVVELINESTLYIKVPLLLTSWDRENWSYKKRHDKWHDDFGDMLYIRYPADTISIFVEGQNKDISRCSFNVMSDGVFNCDLTKLKSYFSKTAIVDHIAFEAGNTHARLFRVVLKSVFADLELTADTRNNEVTATLKIIGKNEYYADLYCEDVLLVEKEPIENGLVIFKGIEIETADYTVKLFESEGDFGFDDDYSYVGEKTCPLVNVSDLLGGRMKILSLMIGENNELTFNAEYDYYIFPEKQIDDSTYEAIVSGVFRNESVMYASRVLVQIKDFTHPDKATVTKINIKGEEYSLAFDKEKEAIIDCQTKHKDKNGYIYLDPASCTWKISYIGGNSRLLKSSRTKMEETEKQRNKPFSIWKN